MLILSIGLVVLRGKPSDTTEINGETVSLYAEEEAGVAAFLSACGYEAPELQFAHEITVPKQWNDVYTAYNELQLRQGFDLTPYKGKAATEYVYFVSERRNLTVIVSNNRIIAVHICDCDGSEMQAVIP